MRLREKIFVLTLFAVPIVFLLVLLYNEMSYIKNLQGKFKINLENQSILEDQEDYMVMPKNVLKPETKIMSSVTDASSSNSGFKIKKNISNKTTSDIYHERQNLFENLHKYSVYNPNFRVHMDWPPFIKLPSDNPTLADIWDVEIQDDWPNWKKFHWRISKLYIYDDDPYIEDLLHDIATQKIIAVDHHRGGTQFKLIITFENGGQALFKPQRYPKDQDVHQNILYLSDFERHHSEIAAYHLDRILGFRRAVPVVGRKINVTGDLYRLADSDFLDTFYLSPDGNYCFHGQCLLYCDTHHGFCGEPHMIEGSFAAYLPAYSKKLIQQRLVTSPWRRTYLPNKKAKWETSPTYCTDVVINSIPFSEGRRLFDAIDCAIFDYLMGNEDRHHYDEFTVFGNDSTPTLIHLDNGRGFGKSYHDEKSILMPLMQCCVMRLTTFNKLYSFHVGPRPLSELMRVSLVKDPLSPVLTEAHLEALDRRVNNILKIVQTCLELNRPSIFFLDDIE